ncbi:hypothetical protein GMSM_44790 [Geomonas sp. Red276]
MLANDAIMDETINKKFMGVKAEASAPQPAAWTGQAGQVEGVGRKNDGTAGETLVT